MRATQVSVRIDRLGNRLGIYADANRFYEAVAAAFNEAANTLTEYDALPDEEKGEEYGTSEDNTVSIGIEHFTDGSEKIFRDPFKMKFSHTSDNAYKALIAAFNEVYEKAQDYAPLPTFGRKVNYSLPDWEVRCGHKSSEKKPPAGEFVVEKVTEYRYFKEEGYKNPARIEFDAVSETGERQTIEVEAQRLIMYNKGSTNGEPNDRRLLTSDNRYVLMKPDMQYDAMYFLRDKLKEIRDEFPVKTLAGLKATGLDFKDYCKAGDEVDEKLVYYIGEYSDWVTSNEFFHQYTKPSYFMNVDGIVCKTCATFKKEDDHWFYYGLCLPMQTEDTEGLTGYDKWFKEIEDNLSARQDD